MIRQYRSVSNKSRKNADSDAPKIKILGAWKGEPLTFDTAEEFQEYLEDHREDMMKYKTHMLNKMYRVNGYRITILKDHGICLRPDRVRTPDPVPAKSDEKYDQLRVKIEELERKVLAILVHLSKVESD